MATIDVLEGVRDIMGLATGVTSSYRGIPRSAPTADKLPAAITRWNLDERGQVQIGTEEYWTWPVRVDLLYALGEDVWAVEEALLPFLENVVAAIRGHLAFNDTATLASPVDWRVQLLSLWDKTYTALAFFFSVETHYERGGSVAP